MTQLSGKRWNTLLDRVVRESRETYNLLVEYYEGEDHPPFTEPVTEQEEYWKLVAAYRAGPLSPAAMARLEQLSATYGAPPAPLASPMPYPDPYQGGV